MQKFIVSLFISGVFLFKVNAQSPGGVSTGLWFWAKANAGITSSGSNVTQWVNQASTSMSVQANKSASSSVTLNPNFFNYNPSVYFSGAANEKFDGSFSSAPTTTMTQFAVIKPVNSYTGCCAALLSLGVAGTSGLEMGYNNSGIGSYYAIDYSGGICANYSINLQPVVLRGYITNSIYAGSGTYLAANSLTTPACTGGAASTPNNAFQVGGRTYGGWTTRVINGYLPEIIHYNSTLLNQFSIQRVESYLALKYGLTLPVNYLSSSTSTTVIYAPTASYTNNIIGISRDDGSALMQKQSHSWDDTVRIYISSLAADNSSNVGTITNSMSAVVIGADNGKMCSLSSSSTYTEKPSGIYSRLDREWKVTNTNYAADVFNLQFKLNACAASLPITASDLRLLVDNDGNFTNATTYSSTAGLSFSYSNPIITVTGISTVHIPSGATRYITIGSGSFATPLSVDLTSFNGSCNHDEQVIELKWQTASETNNRHFKIEKSYNGEDWRTVATVKGAGTSKEPKNYLYVDAESNPETTNISYYRLSQVDYDGVSKVFPSLIAIENCGHNNEQIVLFPNPSSGSLYIKSQKALTSYQVFNLLGQLVKAGTIHASEIPIQELADGPYLIRLYDSRQMFYVKEIFLQAK